MISSTHPPPGELRDKRGLEVLTEPACWRLLAAAPLGRLVYVRGGRPRIVPLNHLVDDGSICFVTSPGRTLATALSLPGAIGEFEVDGFDPAGRTGWSVIVTGGVTAVVDEVEQARLDRLGRPAWVDVFHDRRWMRLSPETVSGRRLLPPEPTPGVAPASR